MVTYPSDWIVKDPYFTLEDSQRVPVTASERPAGTTPYYGANGVQGFIDGYTHRGEYVLIAEDGANDISDYPVHYVNGTIWVNNHAHAIRGITGVSDTKYLSYAFKVFDYSAILVGGTRAKLNGSALRAFTMPLPNLPEQRAIAEVLSGFDEHLANLDELITKKKAIRDGAMKALVSGNSRLGGFGDKWTDISFENMVAPKARIGWQNLRTDEYLDSGYSYIIGGTNFSDGTVDLASCKFVSEERFLMDPAIQVNQGDVLVTKDGTIGKVAVVPQLEKPATLNSGVYVFRPVDGVTRRFLYWVLRSDIFDRFIADLSAGSTIKHLYQKDLGRFHFRAPKDVPEQEAIAEVMSSFEEDLLVLKEEREKVERLKLGAMDDLLTGRVRLPLEEEAA